MSGHTPAPMPDAGSATGVIPALLRLRDAGFLCIVFTNQPERAKDLLSQVDLDEMHRQMRAAIPALDDVYVCPHDGTTVCRCRKPATGMIDDAEFAAAKAKLLDGDSATT